MAGSDANGAFLVLYFFFGGHLPQTSCFRSAKQIRGANFRSKKALSLVC